MILAALALLFILAAILIGGIALLFSKPPSWKLAGIAMLTLLAWLCWMMRGVFYSFTDSSGWTDWGL